MVETYTYLDWWLLSFVEGNWSWVYCRVGRGGGEGNGVGEEEWKEVEKRGEGRKGRRRE